MEKDNKTIIKGEQGEGAEEEERNREEGAEQEAKTTIRIGNTPHRLGSDSRSVPPPLPLLRHSAIVVVAAAVLFAI